MRSLLVLFGLALFLSSPAHAWSVNDVVQRIGQTSFKVDRYFNELNSGSTNCSGAEVVAVDLEIDQDRVAVVNGMIYSRESGAGDIYRARKVFNEAFPLVSNLHFSFADRLLERNCLDHSDKLYRDIIRRYTGGSYESLRQRAMLGVEDVRAARRQP